MPRRDLVLQICLRLVRAASWLAPAPVRDAWRREWEAELQHYRLATRRRNDETWSTHMNILRRTLGAWPDAAWIRRQMTLDSELVHDARHALRLFRRTPGVAVLAALVLGVGIGSTTAVYSAFESLFLQTPPYANVERIGTIWQASATADSAYDDVAPANYLDWRERATSFEQMAGADPYSRNYTEGDEPEVFFGAAVTEGFFDALGAGARLGRVFTREDYATKRKVVVLSDGLWRRRFGSDPSIVSRAVRFDDDTFEVIGVLPSWFDPRVLTRDRGMTLDVFTPKYIEDYEQRIRGSAYWNVVGRLKPGVTWKAAQAELDGISAQLAAEYPRTNTQVGARAVPLRDHLAGDSGRPLLLVGVGAALILLAACANVTNLLLAFIGGRAQEFAVRAAVGAGRWRLARQMLVETLVLAGAAAALGLVLARWMLDGIKAAAPADLSLLASAHLSGPALLVATAAAVSAAALAGLGPAVAVARLQAPASLRSPQSRLGALTSTRGRSALVVAQISLALVLLSSAGLLGRSLLQLLAVDPGLSTERLAALQVFAWNRNQTPAKRAAFFEQTIDRIAALPGVEAVGAASTVPFLRADINIESPLTIVGRPPTTDGERPGVFLTAATPGYFSAAAIPLLRGRLFTRDDKASAKLVALINETAARRYWADEDPIGRQVIVRDRGEVLRVEIVGVVGGLRYGGLDKSPRPELFLPHAQSPTGGMTYVVRAAGDPALLVASAKQQVRAVDPLQAFYETGVVSTMVADSLRARVFGLRLVAGFAAVSLVLAVAGVYGAISFATRRRTKELGVRMALGADASDIRRLVLVHAVKIAGIGAVIGVTLSFAVTRALRSFLFEVSPTDPLTLASVSILLVGAALAASYVPARRATRIDPVTALRSS